MFLNRGQYVQFLREICPLKNDPFFRAPLMAQ
jgi:hypothetical protein